MYMQGHDIKVFIYRGFTEFIKLLLYLGQNSLKI